MVAGILGHPVDGLLIANVDVRILRIGFIVPSDNLRTTAKAIDASCLTWGGLGATLFPYSPGMGLTDQWRKVFRALDPDRLVDCVGINAKEKLAFQMRGQHVHDWYRATDPFQTDGTLQYSALNIHREFLNRKEQPAIAVAPECSENDERFGGTIARFGRLREDKIEETLKFHGWMEGTRYKDFTRVGASGPPDWTEMLMNFPPHVDTGSGSFSLGNLLDLTLLGLTRTGSSYSLGGKGTPESPQYDEAYTNAIIVTGAPDSVSDLALFWNLRADRTIYHPRLFPQWIPIDQLASDFGRRFVDHALGTMDDRSLRGLSQDPRLYIVSASTDRSVLEARLAKRFPDATIRTEHLERFFTGSAKLKLTESQREIHLQRGLGQVAPPVPDVLKKLAPHDRLILETGLNSHHLPQTESLSLALASRVTRTGALEQFLYAGSWPSLVQVFVPDGWRALKAYLDDHGYECLPSDKASTALAILGLVESIENLSLLSSSKVYQALKALSQASSGNAARAYLVDRRVAQFSEFAQTLGKSRARAVVDWLLNHSVLFRGALLRCPNCRSEKWYDLDRVQALWRCDGCQQSASVPLDPDVTQWAYRVNELYARGHDQGALSHLLLIYNLPPSHSFLRSSALGYYPGITIQAKPGTVFDEDLRAAEIDVVGLLDGRLVIAECKDTGNSLKPEEVSKLIRLANRLEASRLIFASPTSFGDAKAQILARQSETTAEIETWDGDELFDSDIRSRLGASSEDVLLASWPDKYLDKVLKSFY